MPKRLILSIVFFISIFLNIHSYVFAIDYSIVNINCPSLEPINSRLTSRPVACEACNGAVPKPISASAGNFYYNYRLNYNSSETYTCDGGSCNYNIDNCSIDFPDPQSPYEPDNPSIPNPNLNLESTQLLVGPKSWSGGFELNAQTVILPFVGNDNQESREKYIADYIDGTIYYKSQIDPPSHPTNPEWDPLSIYNQSSLNYFTLPPQDPRSFMYSGIFYKLAPQTYTDIKKTHFFHRVVETEYRNGITPIHNITISNWLGENNNNERATAIEFFTAPGNPIRRRPLPPSEEGGISTWEAYFQALTSWNNLDNGKWARLWTALPIASREDVPGEFQPIVQNPAYLSPLNNPTPIPLRLPHLARLYESESQLSNLLRPANPQTNTTSSIPSSSNQNQLASLQSFSPSNRLLAQATTAPTPTSASTPTPNPSISPTPTPNPLTGNNYQTCLPFYLAISNTGWEPHGGGTGVCTNKAEIVINKTCLSSTRKACCPGGRDSDPNAPLPSCPIAPYGACNAIPDDNTLFQPNWGSGFGDGACTSTSNFDSRTGACDHLWPYMDLGSNPDVKQQPVLNPSGILEIQYGVVTVGRYVGIDSNTDVWRWFSSGIQSSDTLECQAPPEGGWPEDSIPGGGTEPNVCRCNFTGPIQIPPPPPYCGPTQLSSVPQSTGDIRTGPGDNLCGKQSYSIGYDQETFWNANAWETNTTVPDAVNPPGGTNEDKTDWFGDCSAEYRSSFCGAEITCSECSCAYPNKEVCTEGSGLLDTWTCTTTGNSGSEELCQSTCPLDPITETPTCQQDYGCLSGLTCCGADARDGLGGCLDQEGNSAPAIRTSNCCPDSAPNCADSADINDTRCAIRPFGTDQNGNQIVYGDESAFTTPPKELYHTAQREIHIATQLPYLGKIWDHLVDNNRSLFKLLTPYRGQLTPADTVPWYDFHDGEASGWLTVSNTGNQFSSISDTRLPFFFPHLGGIQDATVFVRDCLTSAAVYDPITDTVKNGCSSTINEQPRDCIAKFQKISIMVNADTGEVLPFIQAMANAGTPIRVITLMDSAINALASQIKNISPSTIIIGRIYNSNFGSNLPDTSTSITATVNSWISSLGNNINNTSIDYWQGYNEPTVDTPQKMEWLAAFEVARTTAIDGKVCIGNFSTGNPNPNYWDEFEPAFNAINNDNGIVCLHEYAMDENMTIDGNHLGRFQSMYNQIGSRNIRTVISETGIDFAGGATTDGWRTRTTLDNFLTGLTNYDQFLNQFPRIIGATTYILGHPGWPSFELSGEFMTAITQGTQQLTAPGIECTGAGSGTPPSSTLPPGTTVDLNGLGVFTNLQAGSVDQLCNNMGTKPKVITILDNFGIASNIKSQCGTNTIIVGRKYFSSEPNNDPTTAAQDAFNFIQTDIQNNPDINYWQGYNELLKTHDMSWVNTYEMEFMRQIDNNTSTNACIGNFKERSGEDFNNMLNALPALNTAVQYANDNGHAICLHEHDASTSSNPTWTIGGHYKQIHNALSPSPSRIIITVAGFDSQAGIQGTDSGQGWNGFMSAETYLQWLQNYADMINSDNYVIGASIFSYGMPNWGTYDIRPFLQ